MRRVAFLLTLGLVALSGCRAPDDAGPPAAEAAQSVARPAGTLHTGKAFNFTEVKPGIYLAVGTGNLAVVGNSAIIVGDDSVTLVDDHVSPAAAWVLLEELKQITDKPLRHVINTHFHFDHAHGNQIFDTKNVNIIGHEFTREMLLGKAIEMPLYRNYRDALPNQIEDLKKRIAAETDAAKKQQLQVQLQATESNAASQAELRPTPPNVTLRTEMTLHSGGREMRLLHLGRGHTAGDVVVYLPNEKIVVTGDFMTGGLANMSDGYITEWVSTLDELKKLDFDTILPGHGTPITDKKKIDNFQAYLRDVWAEVSRLKARGLSAEETSKRADMTRHKANFPTIQGPGVPILGVQRMYDLIDGAK